MIPNQRQLFDIPEEITYLNCAFTSPLMLPAKNAGLEALEEKRHPWTITPQTFSDRAAVVRGKFAELIEANSADVAIIPSVSYGTSLAARNVSVEKNQTIVVLEDQFPSHVYPWRNLAAERGAEVVTVARPHDSHWTPAVMEAIDDRTALAAMPNCHWTDGTVVDLKAVGKNAENTGRLWWSTRPSPWARCRSPLKMYSPTSWWLLPTSGFWVRIVSVFATWRPNGRTARPWKKTGSTGPVRKILPAWWTIRMAINQAPDGTIWAKSVILFWLQWPRRPLTRILTWGVYNIASTLKKRTDDIARRAIGMGLTTAPDHARAPHMLGLTIPGGMDPEFPKKLAERKVYVSVRGSSIRVSPHLYNTDDDVARLFEVFEEVLS